MPSGLRYKGAYWWRRFLWLLLAEIVILVLTWCAAEGLVRYFWHTFDRQARVQREVINIPYANIINRNSLAVGLNPELVAAVIQAESSFRPNARSPANARGLMQVSPQTWKAVNQRLGLCSGRHSGECRDECYYDPELNVRIGAAYLGELAEQFGDLVRAVAAYNAGPSAVLRFQGIPPFPETEEYVSRVAMDWYVLSATPLPISYSAAMRLQAVCRILLGIMGITVLVMLLMMHRLYRLNHSWHWR